MDASLSARQQARPILGIALKIASTLAGTAMATLIKLLSDRFPIGELVFFRSAFGLLPVLAWASWGGGLPQAFRTPRIGGHLVRSLSGVAGMFCTYTALSLLPIVDAISIGYASPLMVVVFAVFVLGETVRMYRWSAVVAGFIGVLIIVSGYVGPHTAGHERSIAGALLALAGAAGAAFAAVQVRVLTRTENTTTIVIYFSLFAALASLASFPFGWVLPDARSMALLILAGLIGGLGQVLMTQCYRFGEASIIAPFDYTSMIWTLVASLAVFHAWPSHMVLSGTAIIVGAGLFIIWRERRLGIERTRSRKAQASTGSLG
jgi:drug/metabolite transporter (DMT)-like permease